MSRLFDKQDIHTHDISRAENAIVNISPDNEIRQGVIYSVGIHPWQTDDVSATTIYRLSEMCSNRQVVAIGETGLDALKGAPIDIQKTILLQHIELSEQLQKPLILHIVKHYQTIIQLRRTLQPQMPWIIHGFRGKPQLASELLRHGFYISLGEKFNPDSANIIPADRLLFESDESHLHINEIINRIKHAST